MISLTLPYPPSANRLWRAVKGRNIASREYRVWMAQAVQLIALQRQKPILAPYRLVIRAWAPDKRRRDIGNIEKPISDSLVQAGVIRDDCDARSISMEWAGEPVRGGQINVEIREV